MKKLTLYFLAAALVTVASCKKDDDNNNNNGNNNPGPQLTKKEMLTAKPWKATGLTVGGADFWSLVDACERDNIFTFKTDGVYIEDEGATKCDSGDPQVVVTSTWSFIDNETKLIYDGDTATIKQLTSTTLVLETDLQGNTAQATFAAQ